MYVITHILVQFEFQLVESLFIRCCMFLSEDNFRWIIELIGYLLSSV